MRRTAIVLFLLALVAGIHACSPDAPGPTTPKGPGGGTPPDGSSALQIRLFTSDPNPPAGFCTLIQAIVTLNGSAVPDGTSVSFSTTFGFFQQNSLNLVSVITEGGTAVTAVCSDDPGTATVRATASVGGHNASASINIAFQAVAGAGPFISFCNPSFGPATGGTPLDIQGGRFFGTTATTRVTFTAAGVTREAVVTFVDESRISVLTPAFPEAISPLVPVEIRVTLGTNSASPITLTLPNCFAFGNAPANQPAITAVLPSSGTNEGNTRVTIIGAGFQAPVQVFFGNTEATVLSVAFNQIVALSPPAFGAGQDNLNQAVAVRVRNVTSGLEAQLDSGFRYVTAVRLTSISNNQQRVTDPFTPVTIYGQGFQAPMAVELAGIPALVLSVSATEVVVLPGTPFVTSCADVAGDVGVVNINTGDGARGLSFRYLVAQTQPLITGVSPSSTIPGDVVTITGANFTQNTIVKFGDRIASRTVSGSGLISAIVPDPGTAPPACPAGTPGGTPLIGATVSIVLTNPETGCTSTLSGAFTYLRPCTAPAAPTPTPSETE